jgi:hypothetical protein
MPEEQPVPTCREFEQVIRSDLLRDERIDRRREAVNREIEAVYETLRPYLEALDDLSLVRARLQAHYDSDVSPSADDPARPVWEQEISTLDTSVKDRQQQVDLLREQYEPQMKRLWMLRAVREQLGEPSEEGSAEPP